MRPPSPFEDLQELRTAEKPQPENYVGERAKKMLWKMFRLQEKKKLSTDPRPPSPRTTYLEKISRRGLVPEPMGIVRRKSTRTEINLR